MQSPILALVIVTSGAPMLPFARLSTGSLLPHVLRVIETLGLFAVRFKCEIFLRLCNSQKQKARHIVKICFNKCYPFATLTRIVVLEMALRTAHDDIFAAPRKLLYIGTMIGQRYGTAVVALLAAWHVLYGIEVLVFGRQWLLVAHQIA